MTFQKSVKTCFKKYSTFSGRASRSEFWFFYLFILIVYFILGFLAIKVSFEIIWLFSIFVMGVMLPAIAVTARRLHDINKSGWFQILPLPVGILELIFQRSSEGLYILTLLIGLGLYLYLFFLYCSPGNKKDNKFGKNIYKKIKKTKR